MVQNKPVIKLWLSKTLSVIPVSVMTAQERFCGQVCNYSTYKVHWGKTMSALWEVKQKPSVLDQLIDTPTRKKNMFQTQELATLCLKFYI